MASGFFIAQGPFFSRLAACPRNRFEDWSSVALVFGFDAQSFRLVVVLVLTPPSSSKRRWKTYHQTTRSSFGLVAGPDGGAKNVRERRRRAALGSASLSLKSRDTEATYVSASMAILSLLKTQSGVTGLGES
jgi:hypothetical protein